MSASPKPAKRPWKSLNIPFTKPKFRQKIGPAVLQNRIAEEDAILMLHAPEMHEAIEDTLAAWDAPCGHESVSAAIEKLRVVARKIKERDTNGSKH